MDLTEAAVRRVLAWPPAGIFCRWMERGYVAMISLIWRVRPEILFDTDYYLRTYPDVVTCGMMPLFHYLRYGDLEGRKPNPLFDTRYYLARYPDVKRRRLNPLIHYLRFGAAEGRQPHPDFDGAFYLRENSDVATSGHNPLAHFLEFGGEEARSPHPDFDGEFYLFANPDVAAVGMNPVVHFRRHGAAEGRRVCKSTLARLGPPDRLLPAPASVERVVPGHPVDVIIPVYRGLEETRDCITSVLTSRCDTPFRTLVVNDHSPEPELAAHLRSLAAADKIVLIENPRNLGFVQSVNAGMSASESDVVLLNSDTLVFPGWLDRLAACAYSDSRTGTVSPFSNNATICSYPNFCEDNVMAPSDDLASLDAAFDRVNRARWVEVPTTVGFSMYIRRDCLRETGLFDAAAFGLGYGEENDFCMRSAAKGWRHKLACDVFVYHAGSVSFGEASARQLAAMRILLGRHPEYTGLVQRHVEADPAKPYRFAVTAQRIRESGRQVFLSVVHALGGGVAQHVRELLALTSDQILWLTLKPFHGRAVVECADPAYRFSLEMDPVGDYLHVVTLLRACGLERMHIHHVMGHELDLLGLAHDLEVPFDFTVHDYYSICPQVNLSDTAGHYCGEPSSADCDECLSQRPPANGLRDISSWRARNAWVFMRSARVIAPSEDVATRIARYYPQARLVAAEHPETGASCAVNPRALGEGEALRIAVLGTMAIHKGFELLRDCSAMARRLGLPLEFTLVGAVEPGLPHGELAFAETGPYDGSELPALLERVAPHVVWFPARWPETFSYTLSTCLHLGLPLAAHDIGAFPERVGGRPWTWIAPREFTAANWNDLFVRIRQEHFLSGTSPAPPDPRTRAGRDFYPEGYLSRVTRPTQSAPRPRLRKSSPPLLVAAAVASGSNGEIQACGYVRIIQPLTHPSLTDAVRLVLTRPEDLVAANADVALVQRTQVEDVELADRIVQSARKSGTRLVYEIDDDLFAMTPLHPEHAKYASATKGARMIAAAADAVIVSTPTLRHKLLQYNPRVLLQSNYIDERLWITAPRPTPPSDCVRIVYVGTSSHQPDLAFLGRVVRELPPEIRRRIQIDVVGVAENGGTDWFNTVPIPAECAASYPRFVRWIIRENRWHWGVAPLLDTEFNRSKSALKVLEYAALGLPSICSDISAYREQVAHDQTGLLVANDLQAWRNALIRAATDLELWTQIRGNCDLVARDHSIGANAAAILSVWEAIQANDPEEFASRAPGK
jgi:GT2 family glycosyltransferase/glycosyltransferase involved in cell wall biosynthesis